MNAIVSTHKPGVKRRRKSQNVAYLFILPTLAFILTFSYYPAFRALVGSFTSWNGLNPPQWVGLSNFIQAVSDPVLQQSAINILIWAIIGIPLGLIPPFLVAEGVFRVRNVKAQYLYRTLLILPMVLPGIVVILIWYFFYQPGGVIDNVITAMGIHGWSEQAWLANPNFALWSLIFMGFPWVGAFNLLIYLSGLQAIPQEILDAALVDGCSWWKRVLRIDVPMVAAQIKLLLVLAVIGVAQVLVTPLLMTDGGPLNATMTPVLYMYQTAVNYDQYGYSMSIAFLLFMVIIGLTIVNMKYFRTKN